MVKRPPTCFFSRCLLWQSSSTAVVLHLGDVAHMLRRRQGLHSPMAEQYQDQLQPEADSC
jgi:hypothetical protein